MEPEQCLHSRMAQIVKVKVKLKLKIGSLYKSFSHLMM